MEGRLPIIHLHGFVNHFRVDTIRESCILDYGSNIANSVYEGPWATELKNDILTADVVVFLGYSLYDPEVAKLILQGSNSKRKIYFINSRIENEELEYMQQAFGTPVNIEKDGFATIIKSIPCTVDSAQKRYVCFKSSREMKADHRAVTYQDMNDLFIFGRLSEPLLQADIASNTSRYIIIPSVVNKVKRELKKSKSLIALHSPLGHGKTILVKILAAELSEEYDVFTATRNQKEFLDEVRHIIANNKTPIIIIDDYYKYARYQSELSKFTPSEVVYIFTSRLGVYEARKNDLSTQFLNHEIVDMRVGEFSGEDAKSLVPLINQAGMWGGLSDLTDIQKTARLTSMRPDGFQGNFADILVGLMNSSEMIGRIRKELDTLKEISIDAYNVVLLSIYLEFTNNHIDEFIIDEALGVSLSEIVKLDGESNIFRIFFSPEDEASGYFSGSIFAKYAMEKICAADDILSVIEVAANNFAEFQHISNESKLVLVDLLRFNYLKVIADGNRERLERIRKLYSNLSANQNLNNDDLFWNAFGMCERSLQNFEVAIKHFRTGISYSKQRGRYYVPFHAQNQLIVCLLERGIAQPIGTKLAYSNFDEVVALLTVQAEDERQYGRGQAFIWHKELISFLEVYFPAMTPNEQVLVCSKLIKYIKFIKQTVEGWDRREQALIMVKKVESFLAANKAVFG